MTTYTITRALSRVKALKDKLDKAQSADYVATINSIKQGSDESNNLHKKLIANAQANADITQEIVKLKLAIEQSNLTTTVSINGHSYRVREAIELKYLYESYLQVIGQVMQTQLTAAKNKQLKANQEIEKAQEETIKTLANAGVELTQTQIDERVKSSINTVRLTKELTLLSFHPTIEAEQAVENYRNAIQNFLDEVDYVLSEANAVTTIEI